MPVRGTTVEGRRRAMTTPERDDPVSQQTTDTKMPLY
jgi:hypothetical protein